MAPIPSQQAPYMVAARHVLEARQMFAKRDNMGFAIPPALIVLLVMIGAAFSVCCAYAIGRFSSSGETGEADWYNRSVAQDDYMREVRSRNMEHLWARLQPRAHRPHYSDQSYPSASDTRSSVP